MPDLQKRKTLSGHLWIIYTLSVILLAFIWYYQWGLGLLMTLIFAASLYYSVLMERAFLSKTEQYISTLSYRVRKVGEEALLEMPIGIILYDENYKVVWTNSWMNQFQSRDEEEKLVGNSLQMFSDELIPMIKEGVPEIWLSLDAYQLQALIKKEERLLYFFDRTKQVKLEALYKEEETVLAIIFLDNYEEITQTMDDTLKSRLNSQVTALLNKWSGEYGIYLKRTSQERFLAVGTSKILSQLEKSNFDILNDVKELNAELNNPLTLSIGIGGGKVPLPALGKLAQSSLDLALGRGGDQVAIKDEAGKVRFYGGNTNPMEKRTRVRARVISHALKELIKESENVIIMGHKSPDMDSLGAAIGVLNIVRRNGVDGYIVFDELDMNPGITRMAEAIKQDKNLWQYFLSYEESEEMITSRSLIVIVDTHKPSLVSHGKLLSKTEFKVVIDHHRRGEEFIESPTLVYMEPYASSTAELVTELLEYQPKNLKLTMLEATSLLAGIIVDTKGFTLRTGSRTFDAASYLRSKGADTVLVQRFMKEDMDVYISRSKLIERAQIYHGTIAIARADKGQVFDQVLIAQAADTLLTMNNINASFVISERNDERIGISARSLGEINVQVIMEKMNGGGHLTNAATQIEDTTTGDAEILLKEILDEYFEGREI